MLDAFALAEDLVHSRRLALPLVLFALLAGSTVRAQEPYDSTAFRALTWREIGIFRGGRAVAAAGSASRHDEYWMGTTGGGVFKTTDGGNTWAAASDKYFGGTIGAIAVSESNPGRRVRRHGRVPASRQRVARRRRVQAPPTAGGPGPRWGSPPRGRSRKIRVHPTNPDIAYVAALGHAFGPNPERGIYKTTDGGKTWTQVLFRTTRPARRTWRWIPSNPDVLYAAFWQVERTPWGLTSGGPRQRHLQDHRRRARTGPS